MRQTRRPNRFICTRNAKHERWIQAGFSAAVVIVDEHANAYLTVRGIEPIGAICWAGGYIDFGEVSEETIVHEARSELKIDIAGLRAHYLLETFERGPSVNVRHYLVRVNRSRIMRFRPNKESLARVIRPLAHIQDSDLIFPGNRLALAKAREAIEQP